MPQEKKNKETLSEANRKVVEALKEHRRKMAIDEEYRKKAREAERGLEENLIHFGNDCEE